jgi:hypothetical protein
MKILPARAALFHADGRKDMAKLTVAFRSPAIVPKNRTSFIRKRFSAFILFVHHVTNADFLTVYLTSSSLAQTGRIINVD